MGSGGVAVEGGGGTTGSTGVSITRGKPLDTYVVMGGDIKRCWFNPVDPLLPNYVYRADVSPDGSKVQISVHQRPGGPHHLCHRLQAGGALDGDRHREPHDAARPCRQDAIRHRPLETRRVGLQQEDAGYGFGPPGPPGPARGGRSLKGAPAYAVDPKRKFRESTAQRQMAIRIGYDRGSMGAVSRVPTEASRSS